MTFNENRAHRITTFPVNLSIRDHDCQDQGSYLPYLTHRLHGLGNHTSGTSSSFLSMKYIHNLYISTTPHCGMMVLRRIRSTYVIMEWLSNRGSIK